VQTVENSLHLRLRFPLCVLHVRKLTSNTVTCSSQRVVSFILRFVVTDISNVFQIITSAAQLRICALHYIGSLHGAGFCLIALTPVKCRLLEI
jgi:hypothetical protein